MHFPLDTSVAADQSSELQESQPSQAEAEKMNDSKFRYTHTDGKDPCRGESSRSDEQAGLCRRKVKNALAKMFDVRDVEKASAIQG